MHNFKHLPWPQRLAIAAGFVVLAGVGLALSILMM